MNLHLSHRQLAAVALIVTMVGCDADEQPINPTDSTLEVRRTDEVPEGNMVPPVGTDTPVTNDLQNSPSTTAGG